MQGIQQEFSLLLINQSIMTAQQIYCPVEATVAARKTVGE